MEEFDVIILGAGPGGYVAAIRAAQLGQRVALVEKESRLGGTCLRVGCIPSKALLESSEAYESACHHLSAHGVGFSGEVTFDLGVMMSRKERIVEELTSGVAFLMKKNGVSVHRGVGRLVGRDRVEVRTTEGDAEVLQAPNIILATGSEPIRLPGLPADDERIVTSTEALSFEEVPRHLVVIGGGAVGLELGTVWRRLGAKVTVVELLPQIVPFADELTARQLSSALKKQGLDVRVKTKVTGARSLDEGVELSLEDSKGATSTLLADRVLVAVGRRPLTSGIGLEAIGVEPGEGGRLDVDESLRTRVPGVWAIGDLVSGPMLAHKASEEGIAVAERIAGRAGHVNYDAIPSIVYTTPELAQVGLTERQAKERGLPVKVGKFFFKANGRAKALEQTGGLVKIVAHAETDRLLGAHIVGPRASELIAEAVVAMEFHGSAEDLARIVHAHPSLSEVVKEAALAVDGRAIHA